MENLRQQVEELLQMKARTERDALVASSKAMTEVRGVLIINDFYSGMRVISSMHNMSGVIRELPLRGVPHSTFLISQ